MPEASKGALHAEKCSCWLAGPVVVLTTPRLLYASNRCLCSVVLQILGQSVEAMQAVVDYAQRAGVSGKPGGDMVVNCELWDVGGRVADSARCRGRHGSLGRWPRLCKMSFSACD
jgi:hypothetical protein